MVIKAYQARKGNPAVAADATGDPQAARAAWPPVRATTAGACQFRGRALICRARGHTLALPGRMCFPEEVAFAAGGSRDPVSSARCRLNVSGTFRRCARLLAMQTALLVQTPPGQASLWRLPSCFTPVCLFDGG